MRELDEISTTLAAAEAKVAPDDAEAIEVLAALRRKHAEAKRVIEGVRERNRK